MKKFIRLFLCLFLALCLFACKPADNDDIVIIYTSDVHSAIDENIGYAGLVAYKKQAQTKSKYVTMVDVGDAIQGAAIATCSQGAAIKECLDIVDYDIQTIGNHEFDYGIDVLSDLLSANTDKYINSNVVYTGKDENCILNSLDKYKIVEYGNTKIAYLAILTPYTLTSASPSKFKENGEVVVDFYAGQKNKDLFAYIQQLVDECKTKGVDYVIALTHLGSEEADEPYSSNDLAKATKGIDVIVDAHSHIQYACKSLLNAENKEVLVTSCGSKLESIGQIVISKNGLISASNITNYDQKDEDTSLKIAEIKDKYAAELNKTLFVNETPLTIYDENGVRVIRNMEMPIGDLIADAYRYASDADIGIANGGGIKADLPAGDISYASIMNVTPYGNLMAAIEVTGQELVDYLEYVYRYTKLDYISDGKNNCEYGSFMQISGLKLTIDTSITPDVAVDDEDNLVEVGEARRLKDVMVLNDNGEYEPIDLEKTYVLGSNNYSLLNGGSGSEEFFKGKTVVISDAGSDYDAVYTYIQEVLNFDLSNYASSANRISIQ